MVNPIIPPYRPTLTSAEALSKAEIAANVLIRQFAQVERDHLNQLYEDAPARIEALSSLEHAATDEELRSKLITSFLTWLGRENVIATPDSTLPTGQQIMDFDMPTDLLIEPGQLFGTEGPLEYPQNS